MLVLEPDQTEDLLANLIARYDNHQLAAAENNGDGSSSDDGDYDEGAGDGSGPKAVKPVVQLGAISIAFNKVGGLADGRVSAQRLCAMLLCTWHVVTGCVGGIAWRECARVQGKSVCSVMFGMESGCVRELSLG